jgi:hypothetical protein
MGVSLLVAAGLAAGAAVLVARFLPDREPVREAVDVEAAEARALAVDRAA